MVDYKRGHKNGVLDYRINKSNLVWVIAFDPGETTGWCVMGLYPTALSNKEDATRTSLQDHLVYIDYGQISCINRGNFEDMATKHAGIAFGAEALGVADMLSLILKFPDPVIVVEDFVIDFTKIDQARHTLSPVRIMSMLSYAMYIEAETTLGSRLFIQGRSMAKTTCTDDRLKRWGLYDSRGGRHARDATRHAFYFLRTCRGANPKSSENRFKAWPKTFGDPWKQQYEREINGKPLQKAQPRGNGKKTKRNRKPPERVTFA